MQKGQGQILTRPNYQSVRCSSEEISGNQRKDNCSLNRSCIASSKGVSGIIEGFMDFQSLGCRKEPTVRRKRR